MRIQVHKSEESESSVPRPQILSRVYPPLVCCTLPLGGNLRLTLSQSQPAKTASIEFPAGGWRAFGQLGRPSIGKREFWLSAAIQKADSWPLTFRPASEGDDGRRLQ